MTAQNRMLLVLGAFGLGGTLLLLGIADRYGKILEKRAKGDRRPPVVGSLLPGTAIAEGDLDVAVHRVDAFLAVRLALKEAIDRRARRETEGRSAGNRGLAALIEVRDATAERLGLEPAAYLEIRERYREWKKGGMDPAGDVLSTALALRGERLAQIDLGVYEDLDL